MIAVGCEGSSVTAPSYEQLAALVAAQARTIAQLQDPGKEGIDAAGVLPHLTDTWCTTRSRPTPAIGPPGTRYATPICCASSSPWSTITPTTRGPAWTCGGASLIPDPGPYKVRSGMEG